MSIFIRKDELVPVSVEGDEANVIWIHRKMDVGTSNRVKDALLGMKDIDVGRGTLSGMSLNLNQQNTILLQANIVRWEGPKFRDDDGKPIPCTPEWIEMMDEDDPLVDAVLAKINQLNKKAKEAQAQDPLSLTTVSSANGKSGSKAQVSTQSR